MLFNLGVRVYANGWKMGGQPWMRCVPTSFQSPPFRCRAPPPGVGRCLRYLQRPAPRGCIYPSTNSGGPSKAALEKNDSVFLHIALEAGGGARARASNHQNGRQDQRS